MSRYPLLGVCGVLFVATVSASALQNPPQNPPVFRSAVDLVTVDVTVVDKDGKPVTGLKADDFSVTLDGKRRTVRALDYLAFGAASGTTAAGANRATNRAAEAGQSRGGRVILLVIDDLSAKPNQMMGLRTAAQRMLPTLDVGDLVGVATTSGLGPVVEPTRDRAAVRDALESKGVMGRNDDSMASSPYVSVPEAIDIDRNVSHSFAPDLGYNESVHTVFANVVRRECFQPAGDPAKLGIDEGVCTNKVIGAAKQLTKNVRTRAAAQLAAYAKFIDALRPAPVPRVIIALSAGLALGVDLGSGGELDPVSLTAAKAGVQLYALTEIPDFTDSSDMGFDRPAARRVEDAFLTSGVQTLAEAAGGEAFKVVGQADRFFARIVSETSGLYQLGVEMSSPSGDFVNVKVAVNRPNVSVRTKAHAMTPSARPEPIAAIYLEQSLQARLAQGGSAFGVPIAIATSLRRDPAVARQLQLGVNVQVPAAVTGPLLAMFALVDDQGRVVQQGRTQVQAKPSEDYQMAIPVPLAPGLYRLRVAVADANGNIGSIEHPVAGDLPHLGTCLVSDLSVGWSAADGVPHALALDTLPDGATMLRASLELYPDDPAATRELTVRLALLLEGATTPLVERELTPAGTGATRIVAVSLPAGQLVAGDYTIQATVLESGAVTGTISTRVHKK